MFDNGKLNEFLSQLQGWFMANVVTYSSLVQLLVTFGLLVLAYLLNLKLQAVLNRYVDVFWDRPSFKRFSARVVLGVTLPLIWLCLQWIAVAGAVVLDLHSDLLGIVAKLLTAWVVIRLSTSMVRSFFFSKFIALTAWTLAALSILTLLDPTIELFDSLAITFGEVRFSLLTFIKGIITFVVLLWLAGAISRGMDRKIYSLTNVTPSAKVLLSKLLKIVILVLAIIIGLNSLGIDLTAIAVFSGAIGLGIGFGLQKVVSNLISGFILLMDRSVKPGDVIEVEGTYGWVNSLGARYVSVLTRDGVEHLIPNENLIAEKVINWSYTNKKVRLKIPVGVAYDSDVHLVRDVLVEAAKGHERVLSDPPPVAHIAEFGDNSVNFEMRVWIEDPVEGVANIKSAIMFSIWDALKKHNVEIPFPQRDVHFDLSDDTKQFFQQLLQKNTLKT